MTRPTPRFDSGSTEGSYLTVDRYMTATPHTIGKDQTMSAANDMMQRYNVRHLPVLYGGKLIGIVSQRDLYKVQTLRDVDPHKLTVDQVMTEEPYHVRSSASMEETAREMAKSKHGSAIVVDDGHVVGILTAVDALSGLAFLLDHLKK